MHRGGAMPCCCRAATHSSACSPGQVGSRDDGTAEPDFAEQVRRAFANLKAVLAAAGCTFDDVVDVTTFHTNPEVQFETIMQVRDAEIGEPPYPN